MTAMLKIRLISQFIPTYCGKHQNNANYLKADDDENDDVALVEAVVIQLGSYSMAYHSLQEGISFPAPA